MLLWLLPCFIFPSVIFGAVIEVTAGGSVSDATYQFSDASGAQVSTLKTTGTDDKITASGALASKEFVIHGGGPADSQRTISSCSAVNTFGASGDCIKAYDGDSSTTWQTTTGTSGSITVTLSNVSQVSPHAPALMQPLSFCLIPSRRQLRSRASRFCRMERIMRPMSQHE